MTEKTRVGIATHHELRERALQIARGERRRRPNEPKIWFTSLELLAKVLSEFEPEAAAGHRRAAPVFPCRIGAIDRPEGQQSIAHPQDHEPVRLGEARSRQARLCRSRGTGTRSANGPFHCGIKR